MSKEEWLVYILIFVIFMLMVVGIALDAHYNKVTAINNYLKYHNTIYKKVEDAELDNIIILEE